MGCGCNKKHKKTVNPSNNTSWKCPNCGMKNGNRIKCKQCGYKRV